MVVQAPVSTNVLQVSLAADRYTGEQLTLPVDPSVYLYARFKHVRGVPAMGKEKGLPLSRLRALDSLIDRLISLKGNEDYRSDFTGLSRVELDFLEQRYQRELHAALAQQPDSARLGHPQNDTALVLNVLG